MKKVILLCAIAALLSGCGAKQAASKAAGSNSATVAQIMDGARPAQEQPPDAAASVGLPDAEGIDVDLTRMSSTMVYAEVANMMYCPDDYVGKVVRMQGQNVNAYYDATGQTYHSVIIADATACCTQGLEYVLADESAAYPDSDSEVTVTGEFELYEEMGMVYCRLRHAVVDA